MLAFIKNIIFSIRIFHILSFLGLTLSFYAIYVRNKSIEVKGYKPLCDINKNISCTKAFKSKYYEIFGIPNTVLGIFYYAIAFLMSNRYPHYLFFISLPVLLFTFYLGFISYFKQKNFCLVCNAIYIINILLTISTYMLEVR
jgi:vitamin-K-epoxide reductase (warfarin-sensitive)